LLPKFFVRLSPAIALSITWPATSFVAPITAFSPIFLTICLAPAFIVEVATFFTALAPDVANPSTVDTIMDPTLISFVNAVFQVSPATKFAVT